ncbi:MAG: hypothetical protein VW600_03695 [Ferrovibrio sp.]
MRAAIILLAAAVLFAPVAQAQRKAQDGPCGQVESIPGGEAGGFRVAIAEPAIAPKVALILLPGGGGFVDLNENGCPRQLGGNSLIRSIPAFLAGGAVTALMDAPASYQSREGLAGYRIDPGHARDIGALIQRLRQAYRLPVWVVGTSRGAISAANAASVLKGADAPDGVVLTSPVTVGSKGNMAWVIQSGFDLPLKQIAMPLLVVGHAGDGCLRSPPSNLDRLAAASSSARRQVVTVSGGPGSRQPAGSLEACEGREPHGFIDQEAEVAAGILRFVLGGSY